MAYGRQAAPDRKVRILSKVSVEGITKEAVAKERSTEDEAEHHVTLWGKITPLEKKTVWAGVEDGAYV